MARETDIDTLAIQLKERLGDKFWVEVEVRSPGQEHQLKYFEKKNEFPLPASLARFFLDSDGAELSWGENKASNKKAIGHFSIIKMDKLTEIEDGMYGLNNCRCCPPIGFKKDGSIWVADSRGLWFKVARDFECYFRINLHYGAVIGWQLDYTPLGMSIFTREKICFHFNNEFLKDVKARPSSPDWTEENLDEIESLEGSNDSENDYEDPLTRAMMEQEEADEEEKFESGEDGEDGLDQALDEENEFLGRTEGASRPATQVSNYFGNDADGDDEGDGESGGDDEDIDLDEIAEEAEAEEAEAEQAEADLDEGFDVAMEPDLELDLIAEELNDIENALLEEAAEQSMDDDYRIDIIESEEYI
ncbi:Oidioi.mRNA.OKI2018_I69.chr2.g4255.t1.cds [Oikopleura dioica]|uniref:Oidioi.mRNA.OKI2018_I69.chr2.g4255.t1.cds n=1 Tax=Oikopleura dioica TaxID=34765 RepID=A0ABN7SWD5_OIKDI|nr:Oidioi.mRNA.OKI2018_I69.chr2.g4255.t1.cds [Oikopleura dioica]